MNKTILYIFFILSLASGLCFGQNETSKWYFGTKAALDFMNSPPTAITTSSMSYSYGTASIADASGNLLFYTDGYTIFDQSGSVMTNGLTGSGSQGCLIIKKPGSSTLYYVFTVGGPSVFTGASLNYSIVDMSLASGNGSVTTLNVPIYSSSTEKLTGTRHCNGTDYWILSHDINSNSYRTFLLTSAGVNTTAVVSSVGNIVLNTTGDYNGYLKISPNGKKTAMSLPSLGGYELCDFDNSTGVVSNSFLLPSPNLILWGCEFSPDGTKFYGSSKASSETVL